MLTQLSIRIEGVKVDSAPFKESQMRKVKLGSQGLNVSKIGLGCMGMSDFYAGRSEEGAIATINKALDLGVTFLDTADMYGPFTNEVLV